MHAPLAHIALNADDPDASRAFYAEVFGWDLEPWGPPGFHRVRLGPIAEVVAVIQHRRELVPGQPTLGAEPTFAVEDLGATLDRVRAAGGTVVTEAFTIEGVGDLAFFTDPSGNPIGAMQYLSPAADPSAG